MQIPLLDRFDPDAPVLLIASDARTRRIGAAQFVARAVALAERLPRATYAVQRCERAPEFLLGMTAAWIAGQTVVMPPTRLAADLDSVLARFPDSYVLVDESGGPCGGPEVSGTPVFQLAWDFDDGCAGVRWPPPTIPGNQIAAILFTSGSTREPRAHRKSWESLCCGATTFIETFGPDAGRIAICGTVSPQHMFGLEATAMAPLRSGCPLWSVRPRFAADLVDLGERAARDFDGGLWLATTPLHLDAIYRGSSRRPTLGRIIVSTMSMPVDLARRIEAEWQVRLDEIYGSTECGMIAVRRPACSGAFTPGAGIRVALAPDGVASAEGAAFGAVEIEDVLARVDASQIEFTLEGRRTDLVKVAGKRTTLRALNDHLRSIDGVVDGTFVSGSDGNGRLSALVVAPTLDAGSIRIALADRIDAAFMPRPLVLVRELPRDERGKLPQALLRAMVGESVDDRSDSASREADRSIVVRGMSIPSDDPAIPGHFPGSPVVPGAMLLHLVEDVLRERGQRVAECVQAKFLAPLIPGVPFEIRIGFPEPGIAHFDLIAGPTVLTSGVFRCEAA